MKILHVINTGVGGGAEYIARDLVMSRQYAALFVLSAATPISIVSDVHNVTYGTPSRFYKFNPWVYRTLGEYCRQHEISLLHVHHAQSLLAAVFVKKFMRPEISIVYHEHGEILFNQRFMRLLPWLLKSVHTIISVSPVVTDTLKEAGVTYRKIIEIPNVIAASTITELARCNIRERVGAFRIGFIGRHEYVKGGDLLIDALATMPTANIEVHMYGVGSKSEAWKLQLEKTGLPYVWHGFVRERIAIYEGLDVVIVPSRFESSSLVVKEAILAGCRVIAPALPVFVQAGFRDDLVTLYMPKQPQSLAEAMVEITTKPPKRKVNRETLTVMALEAAAAYHVAFDEVYARTARQDVYAWSV